MVSTFGVPGEYNYFERSSSHSHILKCYIQGVVLKIFFLTRWRAIYTIFWSTLFYIGLPANDVSDFHHFSRGFLTGTQIFRIELRVKLIATSDKSSLLILVRLCLYYSLPFFFAFCETSPFFLFTLRPGHLVLAVISIWLIFITSSLYVSIPSKSVYFTFPYHLLSCKCFLDLSIN